MLSRAVVLILEVPVVPAEILEGPLSLFGTLALSASAGDVVYLGNDACIPHRPVCAALRRVSCCPAPLSGFVQHGLNERGSYSRYVPGGVCYPPERRFHSLFPIPGIRRRWPPSPEG